MISGLLSACILLETRRNCFCLKLWFRFKPSFMWPPKMHKLNIVSCISVARAHLKILHKLTMPADPCNSSACQNGGECVQTSNGTSYRCDCQADFVGVNCEIPGKKAPSTVDMFLRAQAPYSHGGFSVVKVLTLSGLGAVSRGNN